jgi:hypothetical protein
VSEADEGVYVSELHRARKRRRLGGIAAAAVVVLGVGSYGLTSWINGQQATAPGDTGALAPIVTGDPSPAPPFPTTVTPSRPSAPAPRLGPGTKAAVRQSTRPSPTPTPPPVSDAEMADAQVSRLLKPRPQASGIGIAATTDDRVSVRNETTPDGANVRILSARYDITERWRLLYAADLGQPRGLARCTQNFRTDEEQLGRVRPGLLLCWRTSAGRSVVTVATGRPQEVYSLGVLEREWAADD